MAMWNGGMPPLVDSRGQIPAGAVTGGQPLAGYPSQQGYRQPEPVPSWFQTAAVQGTPWQNAGAGASWGNTPAAGASWANTPAAQSHLGHSPWSRGQQNPYQQQQQQPAWPTPGGAAPVMPRQGWGPAAGTAGGSWGGGGGASTPWDWPGEHQQHPPQSAPSRLEATHGFSSAMAAPPQDSSQPIGHTSWFTPRGGGGGGHGGGGGGGQFGDWRTPKSHQDYGWDGDSDEGEEFYDYEAEEAAAAAEEAAEAARWARERGGRGGGGGGGGGGGWGNTGGGGGWGNSPSGWPQEAGGGGGGAGWPQPQQGQHSPWGQADTRGAWGDEWGAQDALARSHTTRGRSKSPHPKSKESRKRANSFGGGGTLPGWGVPVPAMAVAFDEHHLAPRPEEWRAGYTPRGSAATDLSLSSLFRRNTTLDDAGDYVDTKKRKLADPLVYSAARPGITYDMRLSPDRTRAFGPFKPRTSGDLMQPAVTPATSRMRLVHPRLPWWVDVRQATPNQGGVTLYDVLRTLHDELDRAIGSRDFFNEELGRKDRDALTKAFKERCSLQGGDVRSDVKKEMLKGVKRVDYLGTECVFVGLVKKNGIWEIKTEHA